LERINVEASLELHSRALQLMPGGVSSNARLMHSVCPVYAPCSSFIDRANGSHIWDVDGNEYIDYRLGFGPVILGHSYPAVHERIHQYDERGVIYAFDTSLKVQVAEKIKSLVPSAEMMRFSVTGTEATMHALRIARAYARKEKVVKFEGQYHGAHDYLLFSTDPPYDSPECSHILLLWGYHGQ
jgi:glutamate-1-semialdehyde 2,1-aminomutase